MRANNNCFLLLKMRKRCLMAGLVCYSFAGLSFSFAQENDFAKTIREMQAKLSEAKKMYVKMKIQVFEASQGVKPLYSETAEVKKSGPNYYYKLSSSNESLATEKWVVTVDHASKKMYINPISQLDSLGFDPLKMNLDSLLKSFGKAEFVATKDDVSQYRIINSKALIQQTDLFFSERDHLLRAIKYRYRSGQEAKIDFEQFDLKPEFTEESFDLSVYFITLNGKHVVAPNYRGYKLVEN
jgi:hypothetical protein